MREFVFVDTIERIVVAAADREDAFAVVEEVYGSDAADELILSKLRDKGPTTHPRGIIDHAVF